MNYLELVRRLAELKINTYSIISMKLLSVGPDLGQFCTFEIELPDYKVLKNIILSVSVIKEIKASFCGTINVDYLKYIESVIDDKDGDLLESITYNEIDTTKIGEQKIVYTVSDSSGNTSQEIVVVNVLKKEEPIDEKKENTSSNSSSVESSKKEEQQPSNSASNNTTTKPEPPSNDPVEDIPSTKKIIKYFLFKDGYTMQNVSEACATELKKTNRTGICSPIQDEDGIYLGMKLETN